MKYRTFLKSAAKQYGFTIDSKLQNQQRAPIYSLFLCEMAPPTIFQSSP